MSAPQDRLIGDEAAERFALQAAAVLAGAECPSVLVDMAAAVTLLCRDRQARQEMASSVHA